MVSINQECFPSELSTCCPLGTTDGVRWGPLSSRFSRVRPPPANSHPPSRQPCLGVVLPAFAVFSGFLSFTHTHAHTRFHQLLQTPAMQQKLYVMTELVVHHRRACSGCGPLRGQGQSHGPGLAVRVPALPSSPPRPPPVLHPLHSLLLLPGPQAASLHLPLPSKVSSAPPRAVLCPWPLDSTLEAHPLHPEEEQNGGRSLGLPCPGQQIEPSVPLSCVHSPRACWASDRKSVV